MGCKGFFTVVLNGSLCLYAVIGLPHMHPRGVNCLVVRPQRKGFRWGGWAERGKRSPLWILEWPVSCRNGSFSLCKGTWLISIAGSRAPMGCAPQGRENHYWHYRKDPGWASEHPDITMTWTLNPAHFPFFYFLHIRIQRSVNDSLNTHCEFLLRRIFFFELSVKC